MKKRYSMKEKASWYNGVRYGIKRPTQARKRALKKRGKRK